MKFEQSFNTEEESTTVTTTFAGTPTVGAQLSTVGKFLEICQQDIEDKLVYVMFDNPDNAEGVPSSIELTVIFYVMPYDLYVEPD